MSKIVYCLVAALAASSLLCAMDGKEEQSDREYSAASSASSSSTRANAACSSCAQPSLQVRREGNASVLAPVSPDGQYQVVTAQSARSESKAKKPLDCTGLPPEMKSLVLGYLNTWYEYATLTGHKGAISSIAYSPDVQKDLSGVASAKTGVPEDTGAKTGLPGVALAKPGGNYLASCSVHDKTTKIWDTKTKKCTSTLLWRQFHAVAYSPDGTLACCSEKGIELFKKGESSSITLSFPNYGALKSIAYSGDGKHLAISDDLGNIIRLDTESNRVRTGINHRDVCSIAYSPDGLYIASGSLDNTVKIWNVTTGTCITTLEGHNSFVKSVVYSPDGNCLASNDRFGIIKIWNTKNWECIATINRGCWNAALRYTADGQYLVFGTRVSNHIGIYTTKTYQLHDLIEGHKGCVGALAYSPDGKYFASGSDDKTIKIWINQAQELSQPLSEHVDTNTVDTDKNDTVSDKDHEDTREKEDDLLSSWSLLPCVIS